MSGKSHLTRLFCSAAIGMGLLTAASSPAFAGGNIFLTGHDADFHMFNGSSSASTALMSELTFVRNGSTLPVLLFDSNASDYGNEFASDLTALGISYTLVDPATTVITDAMFDPTKYSAFAVASDVGCGGCDLYPSDVASIAAHASAISAFFNAGGGILGLAAADDPAGYAYVPEAAVNGGGSPPSFGFVETAAGSAVGLVAENGDPTHNYFPMPGTAGLSSAYQVAEVNGDNIESIFLKNGSISCTGPTCVITGGVPEPASWAMMLLGLAGLGAVLRTHRRQSQKLEALRA